MARATSGAATKFAWPLVILGAGFVICLLLAIIFYNQRNATQGQLEQTREDLNQFVNEDQRSGPAVQELVAASQQENKTAVRALMDRLERLKAIIGVSTDTNVESLVSQIRGQNIEGSLLEHLRSLGAEIDALNNQSERLQSQLEEARGQVASLQRQKQQWNQQLTEARQRMESKLQAQQQQAGDITQKLQSMEQSVTKQVSQTRSELQQQIADLEEEKQQLASRNAQLQQRIDQMLAKPGVEALGKDVAVPDGRITAVLEDQQKAYINLGRSHHLKPGMTFEVFDADRLVELESERASFRQAQGGERQVVATSVGTAVLGGDDDSGPSLEEMRGKATIQVIEINQDQALARVIRQKREGQVESGDVLVNLAYSADRPVVFHVHGDFDLDGDGQVSAGDRRRIESLIEQWGGKVSDNLTYEVDYLVLGQQPAVPQRGTEQMSDPEKIQQAVEAREAYEQYQSLIGDAKELSVPLLNQRRFLALVGYYQR
jgi:septal ring factor EnvC (AmiA/AmiB activator)